MATQIEVPPLGESVKQAILVAWHKKEGESVAIDEPICELETDKANVDVPAKTSGVLHHLKEAGETVNVGEAIGGGESSESKDDSGDGAWRSAHQGGCGDVHSKAGGEWEGSAGGAASV